MRNITKISEITWEDVASYSHIPYTDEDTVNTINNLIRIAKSYILSYTGIKPEDLDDYQDLVVVVLVLCQDMWDNRTLYVNSAQPNIVVDTILNLHQVNLL